MQELILSLFMVISQIESGGDDLAVGDGGRSHGRLQIQLCVINDVNRIYGTSYKPGSRYDASLSREIFRKYLLYYGTCYERKTRQKATMSVLVRIWNGGPNGWQKRSTIGYWQQVQERLAEHSIMVSQN